VALIAMARKVILVEPDAVPGVTVPGVTLLGIAAIILALGVAFFCFERQRQKENSSAH
jgi:uncharacterized membrane protein (DUF373 family)